MSNSTNDVLIINGKEIPVQIMDVPVNDLKYYVENPRIYSIISSDGGVPDQGEIEKRLKNMDHVKVLMHSIRGNGGLTDPLIVRDGDNVVLEGNSRLAAYRILAGMDSVKWGLVRCKILPKAIDESLIFSLLGQYHIIGRTDWAPFEQAGYLYRRHKKHHVDIDKMAVEIGLGKSEVKRLIDVYSFMVKHEENETNRWSYYEEYLKHNTIKQARNNFSTLDKIIVEKIKSGEIEKAIDIREKLTKIVSIDKVLNDFIKGKADFEDCYEKAIAGGAGNEWYKRLNKFRLQIASEDILKEIQQMPHAQKVKCDYELKKIKGLLLDLMGKLKIS